MLRNANGNSEWRFATPHTLLVSRRPLGKGFQTIERHVDERLENETEEKLNDRIKADIVVMCQDRGLPTEGDKKELIKHLLDWVSLLAIPTLGGALVSERSITYSLCSELSIAIGKAGARSINTQPHVRRPTCCGQEGPRQHCVSE